MSDTNVPPASATPRPTPPSPAALAGRRPSTRPVAVPATTAAQYDDADVAAAMEFGDVDSEGTIRVRDGNQQREVGTAEAGTESTEALRPFAHAYLDLIAFLDSTEETLNTPQLTLNDVNRTLEGLRKRLKEPAVVGDLAVVRERGHQLRERAKEKVHALEAERAAARAESTHKREEFVRSIEELAQQDPARISWKSASETMRSMVPTWKQLQSDGAALERSVEDELWKRLTAARSTFDRKRKAFFAELDDQHAAAQRAKEELIRKAEALKDSTDWGPTQREFKDLMDQWRNTPRGSRQQDDAQWARFKAAQDEFFTARKAHFDVVDAEQRQNLAVKEELLTEAEAIDPSADLDKAKKQLRSIQDRWADAGRVPRADMRRIDDRLRAVERAVKNAEQEEWKRTDPRTRARVQGATSQLHAAIASYEEDLEKARASGDPRRIEQAEAALAARREWLEVIERNAQELS